MSTFIKSIKQVGTYSSGNADALMEIYGDTAGDLPAQNDYTGYTIYMGSTFKDISTGDKYEIDSAGNWHLQPSDHTTILDLSGYYTSAEVDSAIASALTAYSTTAEMTVAIGQAFAVLIAPYYTAAQTDAAIEANSYFLRGQTITATSDNHFDVFGLAQVGAWYFGASVVQYMDNMPASFPSTGGGNIRIIENQGTNRFLMQLTANSVAGSGVLWYCWYTSSGWGNWYKFSGVIDT